MLEVVKKKTQKVMGSVYKQMGAQFQKGTSRDGEEVISTLMKIMKETSNKMLAIFRGMCTGCFVHDAFQFFRR